MHDPSNGSQWGWHCGSLTLGTCRWVTQNFSHPRRRSFSPRGGTWATRSLRGCCTSPKTPWNSWAHGTHQVDWCFEYPHSFIPYTKTLPPPFLENKEVLARDWGWPKPHQQLDLIVHWEEWKCTQLVERILVHSLLWGQVLQWHSSQRASLPASCGL